MKGILSEFWNILRRKSYSNFHFCFSTPSPPDNQNSTILGAIDSIEVISRRASTTQPILHDDRNSPPSFQSLASSFTINSQESSEENSRMPAYLKIPPKRCKNFIKMTEEEWMQLHARESFQKSSIHFDNNAHQLHSNRSSKRSSILKWPQSVSIGSNDAMQPIREKCFEAIADVKVDSILRKLCDDFSEDSKIE